MQVAKVGVVYMDDEGQPVKGPHAVPSEVISRELRINVRHLPPCRRGCDSCQCCRRASAGGNSCQRKFQGLPPPLATAAQRAAL